MSCNLLNTHIPMYVIILHIYLVSGLFIVLSIYNKFFGNETRIFPYIAPSIFLITIPLIESSYHFYIENEKKKLKKYEKKVVNTFQSSALLISYTIYLILLILICYRIYLIFYPAITQQTT